MNLKIKFKQIILKQFLKKMKGQAKLTTLKFSKKINLIIFRNRFKIKRWSFKFFKKQCTQIISQVRSIQKTLMNLFVQIIMINISRQWEKIIMSLNAKIAPILMSLGKLSINRTLMGHPTLQCIQVLQNIIMCLTFNAIIKILLRTNSFTFKICQIYKIRIINI